LTLAPLGKKLVVLGVFFIGAMGVKPFKPFKPGVGQTATPRRGTVEHLDRWRKPAENPLVPATHRAGAHEAPCLVQQAVMPQTR